MCAALMMVGLASVYVPGASEASCRTASTAVRSCVMCTAFGVIPALSAMSVNIPVVVRSAFENAEGEAPIARTL